MSIASEITRLQGAKADLKTSIEAKGVTVPSDTLISGYASLVDQISGGSGLPDSDGLVDLTIVTGDKTSASFDLLYMPVCILRSSPQYSQVYLDHTDAHGKTVYYPNIVWSCNKPSLTISGYTVTVPGNFDDDVTFTATWVDYNGNTRTTSKTVHVSNLIPSMKTVTSVYIPSGYTALGNVAPNASDIRIDGQGTGLSNVEWYNYYQIVSCSSSGTYKTSWGSSFPILAFNTSTAASYSTVAKLKAVLDSL